MKMVRTFGRTKKAAAALIETIEKRGAANTSKVGPIVRRILADVRQRGDAALRSYADKFDSLPPGAPFVQFTYSVAPPIPKSLPGVSTEASERIWMNLPPARVWVYRKP